MIVKICGITNLEDALAAVDAGADMLGYNFYPQSSRFLSPDLCKGIQEGLAKRGQYPSTVGVFVNEKPAKIHEIISTCNLGYAQLSGDESREDLAEIAGAGFKAIRPTSETDAQNLAKRFANPTIQPALLIDTALPGHFGGTGIPADWQIAAGLASQYPILLAGGLNPTNVQEAVQTTSPWGVDVATGVEASPGKKDHGLMTLFIKKAKELG